MPEIRGITIAVGEQYACTLEICLPRNMRHLTECLVITTPQDEQVKAVAEKTPGVRVFETNDFYAYGAKFNKSLCMEQGFDVLGRHGWIFIWDADILLPDSMPLELLKPDHLHGARRRILADPSKWRPDLVWAACPIHMDGGPIGHTQLFNGNSVYIRDKKPWYDVSFTHAGGGDAYFMDLFPPSHRRMLPIDVLHLGIPDMNWFGTDQEGRDMMARFVHENGWHRAARKHSRESAARAPEIVDRVQVPGYGPSSYELPFTRRARLERERNQ